MNRVLIIVFALVVLFITIFVIYKIRGTTFSFVMSSPKTGDTVSSDTKEVSLTFNGSLDSNRPPIVTAYPTTALVTSVEGSTLKVLFPKGLQEDKDYSLLLKNIWAESGKRIDTMSIAFFSEDRSPAAGLKRVSPIERSDFSLNYNYPDKRFFVIARISDKSKIEPQVSTIFQSYNLKMTDYTIDYQFSNAASSKLNPGFNPQVEEYTGDGIPPPAGDL